MTTTVEVERTGPPQGLTATECLSHVPKAVEMCPPNSPFEAINIFAWGAKAVCWVVHDEWVGGGDPYEAGGVFERTAATAVKELYKLREVYYWQFSPECLALDSLLLYFLDRWRRAQWSTVVDLDGLDGLDDKPTAMGQQTHETSPTTTTTTTAASTSLSSSPAPTSPTDGVVGEMAGASYPGTAVAEDVGDMAFRVDEGEWCYQRCYDFVVCPSSIMRTITT